MNRRDALTTLGISSLAGAVLAGCDTSTGSGNAQSAGESSENEMAPEQSAEDGLVELLFVQEAQGVVFSNDQLALLKVNPRTLFFADRPDDIAGFLSYQEYVDMVYEGPDNFSDDPPNATLIVMSGSELQESVMELSAKPRMEGEDMIFDSVKLIQGAPPASGGTAVLFIDTIGRPLTPVSIAGVHRRHRRRRRRRIVR